MVIDAAVAAAMLTVAAIVVPARSLPAPPAPSLLFFDTWPDDCANLHGQAQTGMRGVRSESLRPRRLLPAVSWHSSLAPDQFRSTPCS